MAIDWKFFYALMIPVLCVAITYELRIYYSKRKARRRLYREKQRALKKWQDGEVYGGQVYRHHSGREYMIIAISNGYCEDQDKWPVTVMYCDTQFNMHYSRPLHEFLVTMTLDREIDNGIPNPLHELMALVNHKIEKQKGSGLPKLGSIWQCIDNQGSEFEQTTEITVKEIANLDRSQPIIVYIENKYPHDLRAMNLYQFLRKYKRKQEEDA